MRSLFQRQAFFILAVLILTSGPAIAASADSAGKTSANSGSANQPVIKISELAHDFGQVLESTVVEHVFSIKNTGTAVLNIDQVRTD